MDPVYRRGTTCRRARPDQSDSVVVLWAPVSAMLVPSHWRSLPVLLAALTALAPGARVEAQAGPSPAPAIVDASCLESAGSSFFCADLVPTADLRGVRARLDLVPPSTPFGVAVTADGQPRYRLLTAIEGLPPPSSLGPYTTYVAWTTTINLDEETRLGEVKNGRTDLGTVAMAQFRLLISAEASASVKTRTGRLVLRATSPIARLLAHRDMMSPASPGSMRNTDAASAPAPPPASSPASAPAASPAPAAATGHEHHAMPAPAPASTTLAAGAPTAAPRWTMPPMNGLPMMPGMHGMIPSVEPFVPGAGVDPATIPFARPREVRRLASGDVLDLDAGLVRRTINGKTFVMYGFNGQYPGPLIQVAQDATITVRFTNHLDMPSAVHWHGIRLDNRYDGAPGVTQQAVPPNGAFTYQVHFKDPGIYWYHPHVREDIQQDLGLVGNILVAPTARDYYGPANRDEVLMLDDFLLDEAGPVPHGAESPTHALMGRFGNVFLVNGEPDARLTVKRGEVVRFFLTNVSNARMYNLSFGGARMKVVGSDIGKFEHEAWVTSVVLAPAERYIVDVQFTEPGRTALVNKVQSLNHMYGNFFGEAHTLATIDVQPEAAAPDYGAAFDTLRRNVDVVTDIDRYRPQFARPVDHELTLTLRTRNLPGPIAGMLMGPTVPLDWNDGMPMENWMVTGHEATWLLREPATGRENMDITWSFRLGDVVKLKFFNDPASPHPMSHPIHLHGQRFLVLTRNGVATENLVWKDTMVVAAGETVEILLELSNPGRWMLHCHIAEHLGTGMMMVFDVDAGATAAAKE